MDSAEHVKSLYEAFARGDAATFMGALADQLDWLEAENSPYAAGNPYLTPQAVAEGVVTKLGTEWDNYKVTPAEFLSCGNRVTVLGRYSGVHKQSGRSVDAQFAHIWTLTGGKIVAFRQYTDTLQFRAITHRAAGI